MMMMCASLASAQTIIQVGASQTYTTIQAAYNTGIPTDITSSGAYIIQLESDYAPEGETYPITLGAKTGSSETNTITIRPATDVSKIIANPASATVNKTIVFDGASYVTIDGVARTGATTLTIQNPNSVAAHTIFFTNTATNNKVKNCIIKGSSTTKSPGTLNNAVIYFDAQANNGNTIEYNNICDISGSPMPVTMILVNSTTSGASDYNTIQYNNIYNYNYSSTSANGVPAAVHVLGNNSNVNILNNRIYWTANPAATTANLWGIYFEDTSIGAKSRVEDNDFGGLNEDGASTVTLTITDKTFVAIKINANATLKRNIFRNTNLAVSPSSITAVFGAIYLNATLGTDLGATDNLNTIEGNTISNFNQISSVNREPNYALITLKGGPTSVSRTFKNNIISDLYGVANGTTKGECFVRLVQVTGTTAASGQWHFIGNKMYNIVSGDGTAGTDRKQLILGLDLLANTGIVEKNEFYNLRPRTTSGLSSYAFAIRVSGGNTTGTTIRNNVITLGNDVTHSCSLYGIYQNAATATTDNFYCYNNSVYIGGTATEGTTKTGNTFPFYRTGVVPVSDVRNNIFANQRTNGTGRSGIHCAISVAAATNLATCDKNVYQFTGSSFGALGTTGTYANLGAWQSASGKDGSSVVSSPSFVAPTTHNLKITTNSSPAFHTGDYISMDDFESTTRIEYSGKMDIGAYVIPVASSITIDSKTVPTNGTYIANQNLDFTVTYSKSVTVSGGTPYIPVTLSNSTVVNAAYISGSGTGILTFRYTVGANVTSTGISMGDINLNGATIVNGSDNAPLITNQALASVNLDGNYGTSVTGVATPVSSSNTQSTITYWTNAVLDYIVTFGEAVNVTGTPRIPITLTGGATVYANYYGGTGTASLTFRYVVGSSDAPGTIATGSTIDLNSGTIKTGSNLNAVLTLNNLTPTGKTLKIDDVQNSAAERRWLTYTAPTSGTYGIGQNIDILVSVESSTAANNNGSAQLVNFSFTAGVNAPYIPLTLDNGTIVKAYCTAPGTIAYGVKKTFRYTIVSGDVDLNGVVIGNIELNGSTINYNSGSYQMGQTVSFASAPVVKIANGTLPTVSVPTTPSVTYGIGQTIKFKAAYSEVVNVTGTPYISIVVGSTTKNATYLSGSGTTDIIFGYTVASGDEDADGITITSQDITLNSGTMKNGLDVDVYPAIGATLTGTAIVANVEMPYVTSVAYPADGTYGLNANLDIYVTFNKPVTVTGTPYFPLDPMNSTWSNAWYQGSNADNTVLKFRYTVTAGVVNATGVRIGNLIGLNSGTIKDASNNDATLYKGSLESSLPNVKIDANEVYTWTGETSNDWSTSTNWDKGLPKTFNNVSIPADKTVNVDITTAVANNLTNAGTLTINAAQSLTLSGNLINNGTMTINSDATGSGQLKTDAGKTATGNVTYNRYMAGKKFHLLSAPVEGQTISGFLTGNGNISTGTTTTPAATFRALADYNNSTNAWNAYFNDATAGNLTAGTGYLVRTRDAVGGTVAMTGTLKTSNLTLALPINWSCVGNPFTSAMDISTIMTGISGKLNPSFANIYMWEYSGATGSYVPYTTGSLQVGQAFFVRMNAADNITLAKTMQSPATGTAFRSASATDWTQVKLSASDGTDQYNTEVKFNDAMTKGLDVTFDAGLFRANNDFAIYTKLLEDNGVDFCLQALPTTTDAIPVGLDYTAGGNITFTASSFPEGYNVVLEDRTAKTFTDLSNATASYTVNLPENTAGTGRFYLYANPNKITTGLTNDSKASNLVAYLSNGNLYIRGEVSSNAVATIYDVTGKAILNAKLNAGNSNIIPFTAGAGIYVVNVDGQQLKIKN